MAKVATKHAIVTQDRVYPAGEIFTDMPQSLIDEMLPLGALVILDEPRPKLSKKRLPKPVEADASGDESDKDEI